MQSESKPSSAHHLLTPRDGMWMAFAAALTALVLVSWYVMIPLCRKSLAEIVERIQNGRREAKEDTRVEAGFPSFRSFGIPRNESGKEAQPRTAEAKVAMPRTVDISSKTLLAVACLTAFDSLERERSATDVLDLPLTLSSQSPKSPSSPRVRVHRASAGRSQKSERNLLQAPNLHSHAIPSPPASPAPPVLLSRESAFTTLSLPKFSTNPYGLV
uniref:Transmembrane protein n=1 Tax=Steinernema glaseri TaxID=37863 RepID=A0A1I8AC68_9BILA